jgi:DeoR family fructose operon transcriptional repressor
MALSNSYIQVNLIGGEVDQDRLAVHGTMAVEHVKRYTAAKAFIGVDGVSVKNGLTAKSEKEAAITTALMEQSSESILLCDSSKLGKDSYLQFAPLSSVTRLITDQNADSAILSALRKKGVEVISGRRSR